MKKEEGKNKRGNFIKYRKIIVIKMSLQKERIIREKKV